MNNSKNNNGGDIDLKSLEYLIKEAQKQLDEDKRKLQSKQNYPEGLIIKKRRSDGNHNQPIQNLVLTEDKLNNRLPGNADITDQTKEKFTERDNANVFIIRNPREEEINKLIDKISKPREQNTLTSKKELRRSYPQTKSSFTNLYKPVNIREKEKDEFCKKLASSESPWTKPSYHQIAKNLNSSISFNDYKTNDCMKTADKEQAIQNLNKVYSSASEKSTNADEEEYLRAKYNHPRIVVSQYKESNIEEDTGDNKMVRIGEFSPLNPNVPGGATVLGLGEWEERRHFLLENYRQVSRSPSPSSRELDPVHNHRSIATQTDLSDDWSSNITLERSPQRVSHPLQTSPHTRKENEYECDKHCTSPQSRLSPIPKCFEKMTEKEIKEFLYRQELEKQIEEKNRLKEEIKKKEAEEEAKIEAKIQRDLEKMRRQYEEEKLQRLELAIRRSEQEDLFRQRLAIEQEKAMQEGRTIKTRPLKETAFQDYGSKQYEKSTQSDFERPVKTIPVRVPYSRSLPEQSAAASALSRVHREFQQPLLRPLSDVTIVGGLERNVSKNKTAKNTVLHSHKTEQVSTNASVPPSISVYKAEEVDILAQKAVFDTNRKISPQKNDVASFPSDIVRDKLKEVDNFLKQPLLPESQILPPVSQPLIHATIPPLSASLQTPREPTPCAATRTNGDMLEDKWKVPYVEQDAGVRPSTKHNAHILTQLGTFRRQLQQESFRMRQRVREDSP